MTSSKHGWPPTVRKEAPQRMGYESTMTVISGYVVARSTSSLFAFTSHNSGRAILPVNDCAVRNDQRLPAFYCVHSVSGVAGTDFLDLAERLGPSVRFYGVQAPPKLMPDVEFGRSVESLAQHYTDALVELQPDGPFMIGGYCVGAVIALEMAGKLRALGREVGPLIAIDGVPENIEFTPRRWAPRYWRELIRNLIGWFKHGEVMRTRTMEALVRSVSNNISAIGKGLIGLNRARKIGGGYAIESFMDVSRFQPTHLSFINRLFNALFEYKAASYLGPVVVYEAAVKPLLRLPQVGYRWRKFAAHAEVVEIVGTHNTMMHPPYVDVMAKDLRERIDAFFGASSAR
jgi:thioesterase domain-containing protein